MAELIVGLAKKTNATFSFVESCTGGMASHLITQIPGSSSVFKGGLVTYDTNLKQDLLKIDSSITGMTGVNQETALAMCLNGQKIMHSDFCLSSPALPVQLEVMIKIQWEGYGLVFPMVKIIRLKNSTSLVQDKTELKDLLMQVFTC